ncbi:ATP11 protein-domain-containing protein [Gamsiella multidivaricata]|uniref:ATP11 protein-domain-containing protein n=1 Tax=Gamsiella multidivaricata TaxID=101098 RepID=UPI0022208E44|nr:ATP11 protein-domain-containing protein [Gamsiella multidivaricata]KAI7817717.1 ATP11 protein-domain-containing protein [Gamsiella multidivaricata]
MASAFRSLFAASSRFGAASPRLRTSIYPSSQSSKLATIANGRIFFRSKHVDYTQKYAEKLKRKAQEEGVSTIEELKAKVLPVTQTAFKNVLPQEPKVEESRSVEQQGQEKTKDASTPTANATVDPSKASESGNPSLDKIMKLELVKDLNVEDIGKIWIQKHIDQEDTISAVVPADTYRKMLARSKEYPLFLLPLSHGDGVEFYLLQFSFHQVIFTSLLEYKTHGENARPFLTLTHYPELIDSKNIVLMNGSISTDPRILTPDQAQILTFGLQQYYVSDHKEKLQLLHDFHKRPEQFSHEKLIELTEISG